MKRSKFVLADVFIVSSWCFLKPRKSERINGTKCKLCICAQGYHTTNVSDYQRCSLSFRIERFSVQFKPLLSVSSDLHVALSFALIKTRTY